LIQVIAMPRPILKLSDFRTSNSAARQGANVQKSDDVMNALRSALSSEPRVREALSAIDLHFAQGVLTIEGEVPNVAVKKLALERAAALPAVDGIVDRLHVRPATLMGDQEIGNHVRDALLQEPWLADCAITLLRDNRQEAARRPDSPLGAISVAVKDGVVTLDGELPSLTRKRLAGALAWWVPGSRDVVNGIEVVPAEEDSPDLLEEAVRLILEKDPFVNAGQIRVGVRRNVVRLTGVVPTESERDMAEFDAWYTFGVDDVANEIRVHP